MFRLASIFLASVAMVLGASFAAVAADIDETPIKGVVKWYNATKGFGFITRDDGQEDVFLHVSALERKGLYTIDDGQCVWFSVQTGDDGRKSAHEVWSC